jgi:hypothetical protein
MSLLPRRARRRVDRRQDATQRGRIEDRGNTNDMPARMNDFDRPADRQREPNGKERSFALLAAAVTTPATPQAAPWTSRLAWAAPP